MALITCSAGALFDAVSRSRLGDKLAALPDRYRQECVASLESGLAGTRPRVTSEFLEAFSRMVGNNSGLFNSLARKNGAPNGHPNVSNCFSLFARVANLAFLAEDSTAYINFLSRSSFQIERFLDTALHFAEGRKIAVQSLSEEKLAKRAQFIALIEEKSVASYRKLIELFRDVFIENGVSDPKVALVKAYGAAVQLNVGVVLAIRNHFDPGLQFGGSIEDTKNFLFDFGLYINSRAGEQIFLSFDSWFSFGSVKGGVLNVPEDLLRIYMTGYYEHGTIIVAWSLPMLVQHELQHAFDDLVGVHSQPVDSEFRAKLAGRAFATPDDFEEYLYTCQLSRVKHVALTQEDRDDARIHKEADSMVFNLLGSKLRDAQMGVARSVLNQEYYKLVGLTYEQIFAPFKVQIGAASNVDVPFQFPV